MTQSRRMRIVIASLVLTLALPSLASAQLGHCVARDWTVGVEPRLYKNDGYNSDYRRIGLTEYEGDVTGTYISWGFGGIKTEWSAPAIVIVGAAPFAICLVIGAMACACGGKRRVRSDR